MGLTNWIAENDIAIINIAQRKTLRYFSFCKSDLKKNRKL